MLRHIYVLIPVFDKQKHYWIGEDEVEKLLLHAKGWLPNHPEKEYITSRYLKHMRPLINKVFARLVSEDEVIADDNINDEVQEYNTEKGMNLNARRLGSVVTALKNCGAKKVIDMGCGEGHLLSMLIKEKQFVRITGTDVSNQALEHAHDRLKLDHAGDSMQERLMLFHSSLMYKDSRFKGYDAACVIEVIEHLDVSRLKAFERVLFEYTKPPVIILTTPNREYNTKYENLDVSDLRHKDHRFEWTRAEFHEWAEDTAAKNGYTVQFSEIGESEEPLGAPTQMGVFTICE
jgi:3' terminal RNA ribose 2'-O-methyltransferase Hen1